MQKDLHPKYNPNITIMCACGAQMESGSTLDGPIRVEICANCHPFFTGEKKLVDTEGMVDKFERKRQQAQEKQAAAEERKSKSKKKGKKDDDEESDGPLTLKELLDQAR